MARNINFGQDIHEAGLGVSNQFADIILGIKTTIIAGLIWFRCGKITKIAYFLHIIGTNGSQAWQALDLDAPAFIVSKVQVKQVVFILRHMIDVLLHFGFGKEMAGHIKHQTPPFETRIIGNIYIRNIPGNTVNMFGTYYFFR